MVPARSNWLALTSTAVHLFESRGFPSIRQLFQVEDGQSNDLQVRVIEVVPVANLVRLVNSSETGDASDHELFIAELIGKAASSEQTAGASSKVALAEVLASPPQPSSIRPSVQPRRRPIPTHPLSRSLVRRLESRSESAGENRRSMPKPYNELEKAGSKCPLA
jgi:hypothetical protein